MHSTGRSVNSHNGGGQGGLCTLTYAKKLLLDANGIFRLLILRLCVTNGPGYIVEIVRYERSACTKVLFYNILP